MVGPCQGNKGSSMPGSCQQSVGLHSPSSHGDCINSAFIPPARSHHPHPSPAHHALILPPVSPAPPSCALSPVSRPGPRPRTHPCGWQPGGRSGRRSWASAAPAACGARRARAAMRSARARRTRPGARAAAAAAPPGGPWGRSEAGRPSRARGARGAGTGRSWGLRPSRGPARGEPRWGCRRRSEPKG